MNRDNMQQRLVCAMSVVDMLVSAVWFMTNLFMPEDNGQYPHAVGNANSCRAQGFIVQFSISSVLYNACLSVYYLLVIKFNWRICDMERIEKWMHIFPLSFGLVTAITALVLGFYHPANWDCWIAPSKSSDPDKEIINALQWGFFFAVLWASIIFGSFNMLAVYFYVRQIENRSVRWEFASSSTSSTVQDRKKAKKRLSQLRRTQDVAVQGKLYIGAFVITWISPTIVRAYQLFDASGPPEGLLTIAGTMITSQGFFNAIVYFRIRFNKCSKEFSDRSKWWVVKEIVRKNLFFWVPDYCNCIVICIHCSDGISSERSQSYDDDGKDIEPSRETSSIRSSFSRWRNSFTSRRGSNGDNEVGDIDKIEGISNLYDDDDVNGNGNDVEVNDDEEQCGANNWNG